MSEAVALRETAPELSVQDVVAQVRKIQEVMDAVMKSGEHYGKIPGTQKPTLLKPGAEKLALTFRLDPQYELLPESVLREEHINYRVRCQLYHILSGQRVASGMGSCNSKERKYQRQIEKGVTLGDLDNTLFKMACKRALVAAVLNATAASDIFSQDVEDLPQGHEQEQPAPKPVPKTEPPADWKAKAKIAFDGIRADKDKNGAILAEVLHEHKYDSMEEIGDYQAALKVFAAYQKATGSLL